MAEGIVDRLQPIDVEHDQRTAGAVALHVGDGAGELAFEAAPVRYFEQEVGVGGRLELRDPPQRPLELAPEVADGRVDGRLDRAGPSSATLAPRRSGRTPLGRRRLPLGLTLKSNFGAAGAGFGPFWPSQRSPFLVSSWASCSMKACGDSPRQDSAFPSPCHRLASHRPEPLIWPIFLFSEHN